jgi:hypothetical protein
MIFKSSRFQNTELNYVSTKVLSLYYVFGKINSVECLLCLFSKVFVYIIVLKLHLIMLMSVLKVLTFIITSFGARLDGLAAIMSFSTFKTANILYLLSCDVII